MKAKTTETHDWVRLAVVDLDGVKANLTWGRGRDSISGQLLSVDNALANRLLRAWIAYRSRCPKGLTLGYMLRRACEAAHTMRGLDELAHWLETSFEATT
jgi:hypothetical protein